MHVCDTWSFSAISRVVLWRSESIIALITSSSTSTEIRNYLVANPIYIKQSITEFGYKTTLRINRVTISSSLSLFPSFSLETTRYRDRDIFFLNFHYQVYDKVFVTMKSLRNWGRRRKRDRKGRRVGYRWLEKYYYILASSDVTHLYMCRVKIDFSVFLPLSRMTEYLSRSCVLYECRD